MIKTKRNGLVSRMQRSNHNLSITDRLWDFPIGALIFWGLSVSSAFGIQRPEVGGTMRGVFNSLMNLQPYLVNEERFKDPKNQKIIEKDLKALSQLKHAFPKKMKDEEPGAAALASLFIEYVNDIQDRFKKGDYEYARHRVRTATGFCFGCHSRVGAQNNFEDMQKRIDNLGLNPFEKAEILAATRHFDRALTLYREILQGTPKDTMGAIQYTRALRHALSITVRVKGSVEETVEMIDSVQKRTDLPEFVQRFSQSWKKDAAHWKEEKKKQNLSGEELVEKAAQLIERAKTLHEYPADENADVSYLRATNYLHEALDLSPKANFRAQALYLLGLAYDALKEPMLWDLDRVYFEACIREFPKSSYSKKCFQRYVEKIYIGYTGSGGRNIPKDETTKIENLKKLAE